MYKNAKIPKTMKWKHPPLIKIYEALGAIADDRVEVNGMIAKVYSSTRNKYYDVKYDNDKRLIMANDNGSYWKGYLGYPAIAFLMATNVLLYDSEIGNLMKGIAWKDINQEFKNDFDKTLEFILSTKTSEEIGNLTKFVQKVDSEIKKLRLGLLGNKILPPEGY